MTFSPFDFLKQKIDQQGPLTVSQYMQYRLYSPEIGYYFNAQGLPLLGSAGDFVTAPEISPLFGEMVGLWALERWLDLGKPSFGLVEWGPGRGFLMADILRTFQVMPEIFEKMTVHLVETSPFLTHLQQQKLKHFQKSPIRWHTTENTLPWDRPVIGIGNEFLDAFPIDQWVYTPQGWADRRVTYKGDALHWCEGPLTALPKALEPPTAPLSGAIIEASRQAYQFVAHIGQCVTQGHFLFIDYGSFTGQLGETLQGIYRHQSVPVLQTQHLFDLTAHVNFAMLNKAALASGLHITKQVTQATFLQDLGILSRALALQKKSINASMIDQQLYRLLNSSQMGSLFKVVEWTTR